MNRALLNPKAADHLAKLCGMFGSDHAGERDNAARAADALVRKLGLTWPDVIRVEEHWKTMARRVVDGGGLNDRELAFARDMARRRYPPSDKQLEWLADLYERLGDRQ